MPLSEEDVEMAEVKAGRVGGTDGGGMGCRPIKCSKVVTRGLFATAYLTSGLICTNSAEVSSRNLAGKTKLRETYSDHPNRNFRQSNRITSCSREILCDLCRYGVTEPEQELKGIRESITLEIGKQRQSLT